MTHERAPSSLATRLGWMALIWLSSILALGAVAFLIRLWLKV